MYTPYTIDAYEGLNEDENPSAIGQRQLREGTNCCRRGALTGTRPGLSYDTEYSEAVAGTPACQGAAEFRSGRDQNRSLLSIFDGEVHTAFGTTLTKTGVTISSGADNMWTFASYQDLLWAAGGAQGDHVWTWDGSSGSVTRRLATTFGSDTPRYVFAKFQTLFFGGFNPASPSASLNANVARYADFAVDATTDGDPPWDPANTIPGQSLSTTGAPGSYGREFNTGFGSYQDNKGDFLLYLTNKRIAAFRERDLTGVAGATNADRFVQTDAIANGCVGQNAFIDLGFDQGDAVYVSQHGIHSIAMSQEFGQRENVFLSWPIRKTWDTVNRSQLHRAHGGYWPEEGLVLIAIPTGSNSYLDTILCMDIKGVQQISPDTARWYKWNVPSFNLNGLWIARDPTGVPRIYAGGQSGELAPFTRGSYSDLGAAYAVAFRGKDEDLGQPSYDKNLGNTFVMTEGSGTYSPTMEILVNDGSRSTLSKPLEVDLGGFVLDNDAGTLPNASTLDNASGTLSGAGVLGASTGLRRNLVVSYNSGYTISHRFTHEGAGEPFFIGQITQDVALDGIAEDASAA